MQENDNTLIIPLKEPRLTPEEKLYVKTYQVTLNHSKAFRILKPGLKNYATSQNPYANSHAVNYHINKGIAQRMESVSLDADKVIDLLLQEATRLGGGSSPTARVQALTLLGKHVGLFEDKVDDKEGVTFNILNYSTPIPETNKLTKTIEEDIEKITSKNLGINIQDFKDQNNTLTKEKKG